MNSRKLLLKSVNAHITCYICKGYFIEATTVIDCLHTFCKSCLLKHFEEKDNCCPKCENLIHQSHPSHYVSLDRTIQDIVHKLLPSIHREEISQRRKYNETHGIKEEDDEDRLLDQIEAKRSVVVAPENSNYHRDGDMVSVYLSPEASPMKRLKRKYICLSSQATITQLKKYVAKKIYFDIGRFSDIDILCNSELMGKDHSLKFIQLTRWRHSADHNRAPILHLSYRRHIDF